MSAAAPIFALALAVQPVAQPGPAEARTLIERYYAAIDRGDFRTAYASWNGKGRASGKSFVAFAQGFARTAHSRVTTGIPGRVEGAAGSLYVTVPVDVRAVLRNGRRQHFRGSYVLRRTNAVPGASREMLSWHIASARLVPVR